MVRKTGSSFDKKEADEIFDALNKSGESKKISKNMQKEVDLTKEVVDLIKQAKSSSDMEAINLYKKAIAINPDTPEAYEGLADIYQKQNDRENEIKILKTAVQSIESNNNIKNKLIKRLKELNK